MGLTSMGTGLPRTMACTCVPVREHAELHGVRGLGSQALRLGEVTSGLLGPTIDKPIAMGYLPPELAAPGTHVQAIVRGKPVPMEVSPMPFVPNRYYRGPAA